MARAKQRAVSSSRAANQKPQTEDSQVSSILPKNATQTAYIKLLYQKDVILAEGPAGCGKTLLALVEAVKLLRAKQIEKIIIIRNAVDSFGESIGSLPGTETEKLSVYLGPVLDSLNCFLQPGYIKYLVSSGSIEVIPLSFLRGRSLNHSYIISDEASSISHDAAKLIVSRLGTDSKLVICGDNKQRCDAKSHQDGLEWLIQKIGSHHAVGVIRFRNEDSVRNGVLSDLLGLMQG
jgi:phosphate starvation-inducible protein PhoH and related proteins